jgi:hypothetical protein
MNAVLKNLWVEALESGAYEQDTGTLKTDLGYCCLGVLCEVAGQEMPKGGKWDITLSGVLTSEQLEYFGLSELEQLALANLNDRERMSFQDIAEHIRTSL